MPKYRVFAEYIVTCAVWVEANSPEQAQEFARQIEGGDFDQLGVDDWKICEAVEEGKGAGICPEGAAYDLREGA